MITCTHTPLLWPTRDYPLYLYRHTNIVLHSASFLQNRCISCQFLLVCISTLCVSISSLRFEVGRVSSFHIFLLHRCTSCLHRVNSCLFVCHRCASYCIVLIRARQATRTGTNPRRNDRNAHTMRYKPTGTDTNWYDVRRCSTNRLLFAGPVRLFWTFQNNRIGLRLWPI